MAGNEDGPGTSSNQLPCHIPPYEAQGASWRIFRGSLQVRRRRPDAVRRPISLGSTLTVGRVTYGVR